MSNEPLERTDFAGVIEQELKEIEQRRKFRKTGQAEDATGVEADGKQGLSPGEGAPNSGNDGKRPSWQERCHQKELFGVCISGGGIRSATFALGVLQGLTKKGLLQQADYLSTVSGGGYIGSWIQGILKRPADPKDPYEPLTRDVPKPASQDPLTFLRKYSNYLAPQHGFSIDTLLIPMIWSRNMILNQVIIVAAFLAALLPCFLPGAGFLSLVQWSYSTNKYGPWLIMATLATAIPILFMARNLSRIAREAVPDDPGNGSIQNKLGQTAKSAWRSKWSVDYFAGKGTKYVGWFVVFPIFLSILFMMFAVFGGNPPDSFSESFRVADDFWKLLALFVLFLMLQGFGGFTRCFRSRRQVAIGKPGRNTTAFLHIGWMSLACASFTWLLLKLVTWLFWQWPPVDEQGSQIAIAYAPPLYVLAVMGGIVLQLGLMGQDFPDAAREWLARAGTLFWIAAAVWAGYFTLAVFIPYWIASAYHVHFGNQTVYSVVTAWLGATAASVLAGKSTKTNGKAPEPKGEKTPSVSLDIVARYGPFVVIGGFLILLALGAQWLLHFASGTACACSLEPHSILSGFSEQAYWEAFGVSPGCWYWPLGLVVASVLVFCVLSWRVNINEFSMHHFYKNRLVRCYLGASASGAGTRRRPDWFTGFSPKDDMALKTLRYEEKPTGAPYPILNATVNVTAGMELATQERKGLSWIFTPWYSGFEPARSDDDRKLRFVGESGKQIQEIKEQASQLKTQATMDKKLVKVAQKAQDEQTQIEEAEKKAEDQGKTYAVTDKLGTGMAIGTAMAISGAAANPNWGSHSSPQTAFLLTLFNVRLGWWIGNPADENTFKRPGPGMALFSLFSELFGTLHEGSPYLNLSDGGHFENLGMYELIRRRCRYVIAIDGEADPDYHFEGLGGAVRKCRADFGIDIVINPRPIQLKDGVNRAHCVVGRIYYPTSEFPSDYPHRNKKKDDKLEPGWLLYIKSSVTGDEPADVEEYRREHPDFPQQSTIEQFFTESQFESYRMLGLHVVNTVLDRYKSGVALENSFERLSARWEMPPQVPEGVFTRHAEAYSNLMTRLADHPELINLDSEVVQDFPSGAKGPDREAVFFWLELIQLAENIFIDLNLADEKVWEHPAYAGWKRVFEYWASRPALQAVWGVRKKDVPRAGQAENYGKAFRDFFDDLIEENTPKS